MSSLGANCQNASFLSNVYNPQGSFVQFFEITLKIIDNHTLQMLGAPNSAALNGRPTTAQHTLQILSMEKLLHFDHLSSYRIFPNKPALFLMSLVKHTGCSHENFSLRFYLKVSPGRKPYITGHNNPSELRF